MAKVAVETVGCRLNQYETEQIAHRLVTMGMEQVRFKDKADLYIINTCTVTGRADADCRKLINRAHRNGEDAVIIVTGCYVVSEREELSRLDGVCLVVDNDHKLSIPDMIVRDYPYLLDSTPHTVKRIPLPLAQPSLVKNPPTAQRHRPMVKIGDGCNQKCSYCIVPRVRGPLVSYPVADLIDEVSARVAEGYHEVVLTAVHIGKYTCGDINLAGLIETLLAKTSIRRIRLSSLEPNELDDTLIDMVARNPRVCRFLHLPLQSGSDRILKLMRRPYSRTGYLNVLDTVKRANPDITIGCDVIVGFPGESETDFQASLDILSSGLLDYAHVFSYSDRPGTPSSEMPEKLDHTVIKERSQRATAIGREARLKHLHRFVGRELQVISAGRTADGATHWAVSDNYLKVKLPPGSGGSFKIMTVRATAVENDYLLSESI